MVHPVQSAQEPTTFLTLPGELRNSIYEFCLVDAFREPDPHIHFRPPSCVLLRHHARPHGSHARPHPVSASYPFSQGAAALLHVCRQTRAEFFPMYFRPENRLFVRAGDAYEFQSTFKKVILWYQLIWNTSEEKKCRWWKVKEDDYYAPSQMGWVSDPSPSWVASCIRYLRVSLLREDLEGHSVDYNWGDTSEESWFRLDLADFPVLGSVEPEGEQQERGHEEQEGQQSESRELRHEGQEPPERGLQEPGPQEPEQELEQEELQQHINISHEIGESFGINFEEDQQISNKGLAGTEKSLYQDSEEGSRKFAEDEEPAHKGLQENEPSASSVPEDNEPSTNPDSGEDERSIDKDIEQICGSTNTPLAATYAADLRADRARDKDGNENGYRYGNTNKKTSAYEHAEFPFVRGFSCSSYVTELTTIECACGHTEDTEVDISDLRW